MLAQKPFKSISRWNSGAVAAFLAAIVFLTLFPVRSVFAEEGGYIPLTDEFEEKQYFGKKISIDVQDAAITSVLRLLADESGLNIVASDDVQGKITVKLDNVPWDQALDLILRAKQLGKVREGNIIRVAPQTALTSESQAMAAQKAAEIQLQDLQLELIPVNYASAEDLMPQIRSILSPRGIVAVDKRTNVILVKDVKQFIDQARKLAKSLDSQTPQVLIEARIVEATTDFTRELGVKWGGKYIADAAHGNPTGLNFPNSVAITGAQSGGQQTTAAGGTAIGTTATGQNIVGIPNANYVVNLPAPIGVGSGGGLGITMGSINDTVALDLQLSAMESRGEGRIISQPKIATTDNKEASITQGISIPFQIRQQGETSLSFIEANLRLQVKPHVTADESIIMEIEISKNAPNTSIPTSTGDPAIDKKEAKTEALVKNGETTVIGGIFQTEESRTELGVPWLSRIPVLGFFFRDRKETNKRSELLIFITPRIIKEKPAV